MSDLTPETRAQIPEHIYIRDEADGRDFIRLLQQAGGDWRRIARAGENGPWKLLLPVPPTSRKEIYELAYGRGSRQERVRRMRRRRIMREAKARGATFPPWYLGE